MRWFILVVLISFGIKLFAQNYTTLKVGDKMPEYTFSNIINYSKKTINSSDFKGKLLILDFWSRGCVSCIAFWPKLEQLQKKFKDRIQILLINTNENKETVDILLRKRQQLGYPDLSLPSVCFDTAILKLFPVKSVPHIVWIDQYGKVMSITYSETLTEKNIQSVLNNEKVSFHQKKYYADNPLSVDLLKPIVDSKNGYLSDDIFWQSSFARYNNNVVSTLGISSSRSNGSNIFVTNAPVVELYKYAYGKEYIAGQYLQRLTPSQVKLNLSNPERYTASNDDDETLYNYLYSYQCYTVDSVSFEMLQQIMQEDLKRYFRLSASFQKQMVKALVLKDIDSSKLCSSRNSNEPYSYISDYEFKIKNHSFDDLVYDLKTSYMYAYSEYPIVNESKYKGKISNIDIANVDVKNYSELGKALEKYGISFTLEDRELEILVISDK